MTLMINLNNLSRLVDKVIMKKNNVNTVSQIIHVNNRLGLF